MAPVARVRIDPDSKQDRQFIVIGFATFSHSTPLHCAIRPLGTLFFSPPPPCVLGHGVGVMGMPGYVAVLPTSYGYQVCFLYILVHLKGLVK